MSGETLCTHGQHVCDPLRATCEHGRGVCDQCSAQAHRMRDALRLAMRARGMDLTAEVEADVMSAWCSVTLPYAEAQP